MKTAWNVFQSFMKLKQYKDSISNVFTYKCYLLCEYTNLEFDGYIMFH